MDIQVVLAQLGKLAGVLLLLRQVFSYVCALRCRVAPANSMFYCGVLHCPADTAATVFTYVKWYSVIESQYSMLWSFAGTVPTPSYQR